MEYHLKLHALKLLRNKKMSDAVEEALDLYFADVARLDDAASALAQAAKGGPLPSPAQNAAEVAGSATPASGAGSHPAQASPEGTSTRRSAPAADADEAAAGTSGSAPP
jgi:hypothetical protein